MTPLWKQQLADLTEQGKQSINNWWLQNKDKYKALLTKTGVVPGMLSVLCLSAALQLTNQWQVIVDGNVVGAVKDRQAVVAFVQGLDSENSAAYAAASLLNEMKIARVHGTPIVPTDEMQLRLEDRLQWGIPGAVIAIDGCDVLALEAVDCAEAVVSEIELKTMEQLEKLYANFEVISFAVQEELEIVEKPVPIVELVDEKTASAMLMASQRTEQPRALVSRSLGRASVAQALESRIATNQPLVHVETKLKTVETKTVTFETEYINDSSLYKGDKQTVTKGQNGTDEITSEVTLVNGEVVSSEVIQAVRIKEPVTQVIKQGTRTAVVTGSGRFVWPTRGTISSRYGYRWGRLHKGLDIAAPSGTAIVAADSGVVTYSGRRGDYGLMIEIDHGNGYVTRYAHCSQLIVGKGARVTRGQLIARVGRTGFATGNHVHFEVLYRGSNKDPLPFLR